MARSAIARLLQFGAEKDSGFGTDIHRGSILSLRLVGVLEVVVPLVMLAAGLPLIPLPPETPRATMPNALFVGLGALTLAIGSTPPGRRWPRLWTLLSIWASVAAMLWPALVIGEHLEWMQHHLRGYIVLVMFGAAAAVPLQPLHALALGVAVHATLIGTLLARPAQYAAVGLRLPFGEHLFLFVLTVLCTVLAASVYRQRYVGYCNHQDALRTSEMLRQTENRLLISENAAMMGRVAAALSHELNSPIGALASSVDVLAHAAQRMAVTPPESRARIESAIADAAACGRDSTARLRAIVGRMQRFTNLDRAEVQSADLNELLRDVVAMAAADRPLTAEVITDLQPLPRFLCRPQQMCAVFSNLLSNAINAVDGKQGRVRIATRENGGRVEIAIADNGRGIAGEQLAALFDPAAFHAIHGRVAAGNWSLFSCRQIVQEHGGEITVASSAEEGTRVLVVLPAVESAAGKLSEEGPRQEGPQ